MTPKEQFQLAAANMENALADVLKSITSDNFHDKAQLERILKLIIKKEIVLQFLLEEFHRPKKKRRKCYS
ncbi:hypothetical protein SPD48_11040 [Pseudogracilibacillus sp. SE30717A]|uniref:hypothetical protein n=1 Tax=Pseudogracilibacillus sp. SE30717A TaxID=3098293 RepID=UPI00300E000D